MRCADEPHRTPAPGKTMSPRWPGIAGPLALLTSIAGCTPLPVAIEEPSIQDEPVAHDPSKQDAGPASAGGGSYRANDLFQPCDADRVRSYVGRAFTRDLADTMMRVSGASIVRAVRPGEAVSMDWRGDRLTVELDESGMVTTLRCG